MSGDDGGDGAEPFGQANGEREEGMGAAEDEFVVADGDHFSFELMDGGDHLIHEGDHFASGGDDEDGKSVFYHGDGAMKKICTGIGFGNGVGGFFELEGEFECGAIVEATPNGDAVFHVAIAFG